MTLKYTDKYLKEEISKSTNYFISVDSENIPYIDYIKKAINSFSTHKKLIRKHAYIIRDKINKYENESNNNLSALKKYYWLRDYHNDTLKKELPKTSTYQIDNYLV